MLGCFAGIICMESGRAAELVAIPLCMFTLGPVALQATCAYATRVQVKHAATRNVRCIERLVSLSMISDWRLAIVAWSS